MEKDECKKIDTVRQTHLACRENQIVHFFKSAEKAETDMVNEKPAPQHLSLSCS